MAMNLPAALEAVEAPQGIPARILQLATEVRNGGGIRTLSDLQMSVQQASQRCAAAITEVGCLPSHRRRLSAHSLGLCSL